MAEQKDLIAIEGIVDNTFRARDKETNEIIKKAPLTVIIQTKTAKECLKIWPGELLDKVEQKIQQGDKIFVTVPEGKKDDYQSNRYNQEIIGYNFRSESTLIINEDILITPENKLAENVQAQQAGIGPTEDEMIEAELAAHEEVEKLPVKLKKPATKKKELDTDITIIDKQNALAAQQALPKQLNTNTNILKTGGFYEIGYGEDTKKIPDAKKLMELLNEYTEKTKDTIDLLTIEMNKDNEKAWAKVQAQRKKNGQIIQAEVIHHYQTLKEAYLLDLINAYYKDQKYPAGHKYKKNLPNPLQENEKGELILTADANRQVTIRLLKFKQFAERDAETKAYSRVISKILNKEWREDDEIADEDREVQLVNQS